MRVHRLALTSRIGMIGDIWDAIALAAAALGIKATENNIVLNLLGQIT